MEMTVSSIWHRTLAPPSRRLLDAFRIVLIAPSHVGNIGSAARAMRTMGLGDLVVVAPRDPAFGLHPQAHALAGGGTPVLDAARVTATLAEAAPDVPTTRMGGFASPPFTYDATKHELRFPMSTDLDPRIDLAAKDSMWVRAMR